MAKDKQQTLTENILDNLRNLEQHDEECDNTSLSNEIETEYIGYGADKPAKSQHQKTVAVVGILGIVAFVVAVFYICFKAYNVF